MHRVPSAEKRSNRYYGLLPEPVLIATAKLKGSIQMQEGWSQMRSTLMKQEKEIHLDVIILMLVILQEDLTKMDAVISQSVDMQTTVPRQVLKT